MRYRNKFEDWVGRQLDRLPDDLLDNWPEWGAVWRTCAWWRGREVTSTFSAVTCCGIQAGWTHWVRRSASTALARRAAAPGGLLFLTFRPPRLKQTSRHGSAGQGYPCLEGGANLTFVELDSRIPCESEPLVLLQRAVRELITGELRAQHETMPRLVAEPDAQLPIRFSESVVFVRGGPMNDDGQTGRKLVCDFYGPRDAVGTRGVRRSAGARRNHV